MMTRENKVGLVVSGSFLCLVGGVFGLKMSQGEAGLTAASNPNVDVAKNQPAPDVQPPPPVTPNASDLKDLQPAPAVVVAQNPAWAPAPEKSGPGTSLKLPESVSPPPPMAAPALESKTEPIKPADSPLVAPATQPPTDNKIEPAKQPEHRLEEKKHERPVPLSDEKKAEPAGSIAAPSLDEKKTPPVPATIPLDEKKAEPAPLPASPPATVFNPAGQEEKKPEATAIPRPIPLPVVPTLDEKKAEPTPLPVAPLVGEKTNDAVTPVAPAPGTAILNDEPKTHHTPATELKHDPAHVPDPSPAPAGEKAILTDAPKPIPQEVVAPVPSPVAAGRPTPKPPINDSYLEEEYRVAGGDSFSSICKRFHYGDKYAEALQQYNHDYPIASASLRQSPPRLSPGTVVWIPPIRILEKRYASLIPDLKPAVSPAAAATTDATWTTSSARPPAAKTYRVHSGGESLQDIARKALSKPEAWGDIYRLNPSLNANPATLIPEGTLLRVPAEARVDG